MIFKFFSLIQLKNLQKEKKPNFALSIEFLMKKTLFLIFYLCGITLFAQTHRTYLELKSGLSLPILDYSSNNLETGCFTQPGFTTSLEAGMKIYKRCEAQVRLITGENFKRLEFAKTHDMQSHVNERSKKMSHDRIVLIHDAVIIAPNQSGTKVRCNLCQNKGSPEQFKHMKPSMLRSI